jgi:type II secretory pathway component PulK
MTFGKPIHSAKPRRRAARHRSAAHARAQSGLRRGILLVIVLLVIALLSLAGYSYSEYMFSEYRGTRVNARLIQARLFAESGVDSIKAFLLNDEATRDQSGGVYENSPLFQAVMVQDSDADRERGRFSVVAPQIDDDGARAGFRFGLEDESTRLNINALPMLEGLARQKAEVDSAISGAATGSESPGRDLLMALPGMTEDIADAILDWIDADDEPREFGCEAEEYANRSPPYKPRNGPLMSVEELLLVRGVTPQLLFGADVNRNGVIDASEASMAQGGNEQGSLDAGWAGYLTLYSAEKNIRADGRPRINLNQDDLSKLSDELSEVFTADQVSFIIHYRQNGPTTNNPTGGAALPAPDLTQPAKFPFQQVLTLVGAKTQVQNSEGSVTAVPSPFADDLLQMATYLPTLMDNCTVNAAPVIPGRININQAPRAILAGIPGITDDIVDAILSSRTPETTENENRRSESWLLSEGICTLEEMKLFMPYMNGGGSVYHAQVVGYFDQDGPSARLETVIDATGATPRIVFWRDITNLGPGYPTAELGIEARN